jgi:outer membrane protein
VRALLAVFALLLAAAPRARAVEPVVALRLGVGAAVGSAARDVPVSDVVPAQYPLQLDVLGREGPLALGAYGSFGLASAGRCAGASCSAWAARIGLQGTWTFTTAGGSEPWLGVATGYEWISESRTQGGTVTSKFRGPELLALQGGIEWRIAPWLALGPYALVSLGRYVRYSVDTGVESGSVAIPDRAFHAWFHAGVRGRLVLGDRR